MFRRAYPLFVEKPLSDKDLDAMLSMVRRRYLPCVENALVSPRVRRPRPSYCDIVYPSS